ncbi:metal ABC transporter permease [Haloarcula salinisoli]|uniref:Metal ABC transporter permease n=1 Tax=Haloarcula salinisoli TaxID=2487746 RepID=A0A8J7YJX0_9EURY|nr:metal ABC transporter permease [Halomicroarcula salinisoli]MBX0287175.1 metal ABC transporter permease [Halomicroarcula salinisoli]MBX0304479.1 metal ABC transporter permease [Halomicroarcula salinisoli]
MQALTLLWLVAPLEWFLDDVWGTLLDVVAGATGLRLLDFPFMQRAYLAAVCIAIIGPLVGSFLVHREMAMIGDTLAHSAFAGVAIGLFVNATLSLSVPPLATALVVAVLAALLVQALVDYAGAYTDTSLAIVLTGAFAVGSVLVTATDGGIAVGINAYLFGSLATVSRASTGLLLAMSLLVVAVVTVAYRPLAYVTFDEVGARAAGLDVGRYNRLLVVLTAVVVVGSMQIMGVILVAAMLVIPVAAATAVGGFKRSVVAAVVVGQAATLTGTTLSYTYDVAAGGAIVLVAIGIFAVVRVGMALRTG